MHVKLTKAYRSRIADALMGGAVAAGLRPVTARLGTGAGGRPPGEAMYSGSTTQATLLLNRDANTDEVRAGVVLPPDSQVEQFDELGLYAEDGALLLHATFQVQVITPGIESSFDFVFNPEVTL